MVMVMSSSNKQLGNILLAKYLICRWFDFLPLGSMKSMALGEVFISCFSQPVLLPLALELLEKPGT